MAGAAAGGKLANGLSANGINSTNHHHNHHPHRSSTPTTHTMDHDDDGDNRTRNAKAQRRHREKRKAHLKALEESVQVLTVQLDDARRQLGSSTYYSQQGGGGRAPLSPPSKDVAQLQAENAYLREENNDLRRQLYVYRGAYGHDGDVKSEPFMYTQAPLTVSPRRQRGSGDLGPVHETGTSAADAASSSSSSSYPPPIDHYSQQRSRGRLSASSAPNASSYSDPRTLDARYPPPASMRYETQSSSSSSSLYPGATPHSVPRYDVPAAPHPHTHPYAPRSDTGHGHGHAHGSSSSHPHTHDPAAQWSSETSGRQAPSGHSFPSYAISGYHEGSGGASAGHAEDWRQDH